jgi:glyoxylase-like metal-dependent hydrolase (beta-lactamase superfamily II)
MIVGALAALALLAAAPVSASTPPAPAPVRLAPHVWVLPGGLPPGRQPDGNTVLIRGPVGFVVVDTGRHAWHRRAIVDLARSQKGRVVGIVNTHWHLDHVSGNAELKRRWPGAKLHASQAVHGALAGFLADGARRGREALSGGALDPVTADEHRGDLATVENSAALKPDVPVERSEVREIAGRRLQLGLATRAATEGDVWVYDPGSGVLAAGDLVTLPAPFLDTACPEGWRAALERLAETPFKTLVPGHGPVMDRGGLEIYRRAYGGLLDCAASARSKDVCADEWSQAVSALLAPDGNEVKIARGMTAYYVGDVLRRPEVVAQRCGGA